MSNGTKVKKRNGSIEPLNLEKMHVMVEQACNGLAGVSASQVEIQSGIQSMTESQQEKSKKYLFAVLLILLTLIILTISSWLLGFFYFL